MSPFRHIAISILALACTLLPMAVSAQEPSGSELEPGLAGTEYYVAFPQSDKVARTKFIGLVISSQFATEVVVEVYGRAPMIFETVPGQARTVALPASIELSQEETEQVTRKGVRITSRAPISVYVLNSRYLATGGYAALPITQWGTSYQALTLPNHLDEKVSEIVVVAAYDSTSVTIRPAAETYHTAAGHERVRWLSKGETFSLSAFPSPDQVGVADLSASYIQSNKPVGVISGHVRTAIKPDPESPASHLDYATHQAAMILPEDSWRTNYLSIPFRPGGASDRFRLIPATNGTYLTMTHFPATGGIDTAQIILDRGEYTDITTIKGKPITGPVFWQSSGRILLMQLRTSGPFSDRDPKNSPAMVPLAAVQHFTSRSVFSAPDQIDQAFFTHTLTLIAKGPTEVAADDPSNPLRSLRLDGRPVYEIAPGILTQQIGSTGYYHVTLSVESGGHMVSSDPAWPFTGIIKGDNGIAGNDSYIAGLPFWLPEIAADVAAPWLVQKQEPTKGNIWVEISDSTNGYFSGVRDVRPTPASTGWKQQDVFNAPSPDENATAKFRAIADPSGPLDVELVDRDGNRSTIRLNDGVCFKTATANRSSIRIDANVGNGIFSETVVLQTNSCGEMASIKSLGFVSGNASGYLEIQEGTAAFDIAAGESKLLTLIVKGNPPVGTYTTTLAIKANDSTISIPVELVVGTSSVPVDAVTPEIAGFYPNPFTGSTTLRLAHPLDRGTALTISDHLGRVVRVLDTEGLLGRSQIVWNGDDAAGQALPSGLYLITVDRQGARSARAVTLVRQ